MKNFAGESFLTTGSLVSVSGHGSFFRTILSEELATDMFQTFHALNPASLRSVVKIYTSAGFHLLENFDKES